MLPVIVRIGPIALYSWGVLLALAFAACWVVARWYLPRRGVDADTATDLLLAAAVGGIIGSRALYIASNWDTFAAHPLWIFELQRGGMVFYGGLAGGAAAVLAYILWAKVPVPPVADAAAVTVPLGSAIGRIGCFLNGCCGGVSTTSILGVDFPGAGASVLPTQLIDAAANGLIFAAVLHVAARDRPRPGVLWWMYLTVYGISRFLVESIRVNPKVWLGLSQAQLLSVPVFIAGVVGLYWMWRHGGLRTADAGGEDDG